MELFVIENYAVDRGLVLQASLEDYNFIRIPIDFRKSKNLTPEQIYAHYLQENPNVQPVQNPTFIMGTAVTSAVARAKMRQQSLRKKEAFPEGFDDLF